MKYALLFLSCLCVMACGDREPRVVQNQKVGNAFGTSYSLIYQTDRTLDLQKEIDSVFAAVNRSLSTYIPDSDISRINYGDTTISVDHMFQDVFKLSKEIHAKTNGYFDPTVGVLVNAWGFGPENQIAMDSSRVDSLLHFVGFDKVYLTESNSISKSNPNIRIDFNAIAKGYGIDRLAVLMDEKGVGDYLLEVGGEVVAKGENQIKKKPWVVGIDDPQVVEGRALKTTIKLKDIALASSGNYRKFRIDSASGQKYVHTIDPKTGFTKSGNTLAATVLANSCAKADGYATALMALDLAMAEKLVLSEKDLEAYIIYLDENGETQEFMTEGFRRLVFEPRE